MNAPTLHRTERNKVERHHGRGQGRGQASWSEPSEKRPSANRADGDGSAESEKEDKAGGGTPPALCKDGSGRDGRERAQGGWSELKRSAREGGGGGAKRGRGCTPHKPA